MLSLLVFGGVSLAAAGYLLSPIYSVIKAADSLVQYGGSGRGDVAVRGVLHAVRYLQG